MLSVRMLGVFSISVDGERLAEDVGPAGRQLCGYLFEFIGRVHRRERLADQFWGHLDPDRARAALNTALWRLRKLLARDAKSQGGQNLRSYGSEIVLEPACWLDVDTHGFDAAMKDLFDARSSRRISDRLPILESAIESYAGPFLDGEDADWILEERERLHSLYARAASELLSIYGLTTRYEEAIAVARRIVAADPFRESTFRKLAVLLVLNGQRGEALRQYERWGAMFRRELGIEPMPQTLRLAEDIRSGGIFERLDAVKTQNFSISDPRPRDAAGDRDADHDGFANASQASVPSARQHASRHMLESARQTRPSKPTG
jgi:DNA-binding SARP family transcriptional activator